MFEDRKSPSDFSAGSDLRGWRKFAQFPVEGGEDCCGDCTHHTWPPSNAEDAVWRHDFFPEENVYNRKQCIHFWFGWFFKDCLEDAGILIFWFLFLRIVHSMLEKHMFAKNFRYLKWRY